jgi:hypothetical protein
MVTPGKLIFMYRAVPEGARATRDDLLNRIPTTGQQILNLIHPPSIGQLSVGCLFREALESRTYETPLRIPSAR